VGSDAADSAGETAGAIDTADLVDACPDPPGPTGAHAGRAEPQAGGEAPGPEAPGQEASGQEAPGPEEGRQAARAEEGQEGHEEEEGRETPPGQAEREEGLATQTAVGQSMVGAGRPHRHAGNGCRAAARMCGIATVSVVLAAACAAPAASDPTALVQTMLTHSAAAWNRRDLAGFVADYAPDSSTTFVSGGHVRHGFDWIRQNYATAFAPGAPHDSLRFEEVEARALGNDFMLATARYILFRGDSITSSGPFTLLLRHVSGQWKIVHDHTSRD
jgi:uncharacterized protein (TIGR02246 family)